MSHPAPALDPSPDERNAKLEAIGEESLLESPMVKTAIQVLKDACGHNERDVKSRARANAIIVMASSGMRRAAIAKALGMKPNAVRVALWRARSGGLLNDLRDKLEHDLTALAVDSAEYHLKRKDKDVTVEHLKGVGFYKNHSHAKHEGGGPGFVMPPLQVNVVFNQEAKPVAGQALDFSENAVGVARTDANDVTE